MRPFASFKSGHLSVRTRIVALAVIPVLAFFANGFAFTIGEAEVAATFQSVKRATALADSSHDFKAALSDMRIHARDFGAQPGPSLIKSFEIAHMTAVRSLETIEGALDLSKRPDLLAVRQTLSEVIGDFSELTRHQSVTGFNESEGTRRSISSAATAVERIIHEDLSWMREADGRQLLMSLLTMRRYESEYRANGGFALQTAFFDEYNNFKNVLASAIAADVMKDQLHEQVRGYAESFSVWIASVGKVGPLILGIDQQTQGMMPIADDIIWASRQNEEAAATALAASQSATRLFMTVLALGSVLAGLGLSWIIGRSITGPLQGLASSMRRLASGDTGVLIPATHGSDEIGEMARSVIVFRDNMVEREQLAAAAVESGHDRERRGDTIASTIVSFRHSVQSVLGRLRGAATDLEHSSSSLTGAADAVSAEAKTAEALAGAASRNVTSAAGSVEELAASIAEIAGRAAKSTEVAERAVFEAQRTTRTMAELGGAADRIGQVVGLIQAIAGQTNLLALNATIEAARAGESGRGFAVVAAEVKSLAGQTARATEEIAAQIGAIQSAAADATLAIGHVNAIIADMSGIAATVAQTVEEQNRAVCTIAEGVHQASLESQDGAHAMGRVAGTTAQARITVADVRSLADVLSAEAEALETEVQRFLIDVQAA